MSPAIVKSALLSSVAMSKAEREIMHNRNLSTDRKSGMTGEKFKRRYPIGAELMGNGQTHFRVWAPKADRVEVAIEGEWRTSAAESRSSKFFELQPEPNGYFSGSVQAGAGNLYRLR